MHLHPKVLELRNRIGYKPIHYFNAKQNILNSQPIEIRSVKSDTTNERLIKQYFCIFGIPDDNGTVPVKGCFSKSLQERGPGSAGNYKILVLNQHDQKDPMCIPIVLRENEIGLYGEYEPDPIPSGDRLVIQVRKKTINQGSYGFNYVWDKMEYIEDTGLILMKEVDLFEVSPVSIGSQTETFVVRSSDGTYSDSTLEEDTSSIIKRMDRKYRLELRQIIDRQISLAKLQPPTQTEEALEETEPINEGLDYNFLIKNL